jgi:hypothetical protein
MSSRNETRGKKRNQPASGPTTEASEKRSGEGAASALARLRSLEKAKAEAEAKTRPSASEGMSERL